MCVSRRLKSIILTRPCRGKLFGRGLKKEHYSILSILKNTIRSLVVFLYIILLQSFSSKLFQIRLMTPIAVKLVSSWPRATDVLLWIMYNIWCIIIGMELKSHLMYSALWPAQEQLLPLKRRELFKVRYILMTVMKMLLEAHNNELPVINYTSRWVAESVVTV